MSRIRLIIAFGCPQFPQPWKEAELIILPKQGEDPKFPQRLRPISFMNASGKLFEIAILQCPKAR